MRISAHTTVDLKLKQLAEDCNIEITKALEFGLKFLLAEKDLGDYPHNRLLININKLNEVIEQLNTKIEELTPTIQEVKETDTDENKDIFEEIISNHIQ